VLASAATYIEQRASERASLGEPNEGGLRAPDVPGRRRAGIRVIPVTVLALSFGHILILPAHLPGR
jgi:hypothetical protein